MIAVTQDPRGVVGGAAAVAELELLEPQHRVAARRQVPGGAGAERAQPDDDVVDVRWRVRASDRPARPTTPRSPAAGAASGGCRPSRPPSARTSRGSRHATTCRAGPTRRWPSPDGSPCPRSRRRPTGRSRATRPRTAANSRRHSIAVRSTASGRSTNAATWSAEHDEHQVRVDQLALVPHPLVLVRAPAAARGRSCPTS